MTDIDSTAAEVLMGLDDELNAKGTSLAFAELKHQVHKKFGRYGVMGNVNPDHFFPTVEAAVEQYTKETGATWKK